MKRSKEKRALEDCLGHLVFMLAWLVLSCAYSVIMNISSDDGRVYPIYGRSIKKIRPKKVRGSITGSSEGTP